MTGAFLIFLISLASQVKGDPSSFLTTGLVYAPGHASVDYYSYPRYAFNYAVNDPHTGDNKAQWEKREGNVVKGAYSLVEPGGSVRLVEYFDDGNGFNAIVKRIGPNVHPVTIPHAPIYKAPIPVLGHGPTISGPLTIGPIAHLPHLAQAPLISGPMGAAAISSIPLIKNPISKPLVTHGPIYNAPIIREPAHKTGPIIPAFTTPIIHKPLFSPVNAPIVTQVHVPEIPPNDHTYSPLTHHIPKPSDDYINHQIHSSPIPSVSPWDLFIKDVPSYGYLEPHLLNKYLSPEFNQPQLYYNLDHIGYH